MSIKQVFKTSDGSVFDTQEQAEIYEKGNYEKQDILVEMSDLGQRLCILRDKLHQKHDVDFYSDYDGDLDDAFYRLERFCYFKGDTEKYNSSECVGF